MCMYGKEKTSLPDVLVDKVLGAGLTVNVLVAMSPVALSASLPLTKGDVGVGSGYVSTCLGFGLLLLRDLVDLFS